MHTSNFEITGTFNIFSRHFIQVIRMENFRLFCLQINHIVFSARVGSNFLSSALSKVCSSTYAHLSACFKFPISFLQSWTIDRIHYIHSHSIQHVWLPICQYKHLFCNCFSSVNVRRDEHSSSFHGMNLFLVPHFQILQLERIIFSKFKLTSKAPINVTIINSHQLSEN